MLSVETARNSALNEILSFTYPKLHTGSCWFISFYAFDPAKGEMRRKRIKINSVGNASQRRRCIDQKTGHGDLGREPADDRLVRGVDGEGVAAALVAQDLHALA